MTSCQIYKKPSPIRLKKENKVSCHQSATLSTQCERNSLPSVIARKKRRSGLTSSVKLLMKKNFMPKDHLKSAPKTIQKVTFKRKFWPSNKDIYNMQTKRKTNSISMVNMIRRCGYRTVATWRINIRKSYSRRKSWDKWQSLITRSEGYSLWISQPNKLTAYRDPSPFHRTTMTYG